MAVGLAAGRRGQKLPGEIRGRSLKAFGDELRHYRKMAGLSQEALARLTAMHFSEIGVLERGLREPRITTCFKLAEALDIPYEHLLETAAGSFAYEHQRGAER
jgi:transcriptional regulator with XRE-family HTH domain